MADLSPTGQVNRYTLTAAAAAPVGELRQLTTRGTRQLPRPGH